MQCKQRVNIDPLLHRLGAIDHDSRRHPAQSGLNGLKRDARIVDCARYNKEIWGRVLRKRRVDGGRSFAVERRLTYIFNLPCGDRRQRGS